MTMAPADALRWMRQGQQLFDATAARLDAAACAAPSLLPDWTRGHVLAHVAANADALLNLAHWARTGTETPMYTSPDQRAAGIERGAMLPAADLTAWQTRSATALATALDALSEDQWAHAVRTAHGRTVPATQIPWLRAREVMIHAVDLDTGTTFADLPTDFLDALVADITAKRGGAPDVAGPLPEVAAWLAGRPHHLSDAPDLGPWL
ncbi:maleylpyruvate isomerase family mycothiol-dependent enzyme [Nocardioides sp. BYT-33-1]|uniref:maleylpyruvate isomerase family mycothiol-dependent enzyme n=1 Tax=Nocardioides sp. BYT-33-1 TaxID=3416952 RepID=UPI003F52D53F